MANKKVFIDKDNVNARRAEKRTQLENLYYNMFFDGFKVEGLEPIKEDYIMKAFWSKGTVAGFNVKRINESCFTDYSTQTYNIYDFPETVKLTNKREVPFIPTKSMTVGKDVAIGWIQSNHKGIRMMILPWIEKMVEVEMVINTNLVQHKVPWFFVTDQNSVDQVNDIIDRILNDEVAITLSAQDIEAIKAVATGQPYIIDKLTSYYNELDSKVKTFLGVDNAMQVQEGLQRTLVDQVCSNDEEINGNANGFLRHMKTFFDEVNELCGTNYVPKQTHKQTKSVHENAAAGEEMEGDEE